MLNFIQFEKPPSTTIKVICGLFFVLVAIGFVRGLTGFMAHGYLIALIGKSRAPHALPGIFGLMSVIAGPLACAAFGFIGLRKFMAGIFCVVLAIALLSVAQIGKLPCASSFDGRPESCQFLDISTIKTETTRIKAVPGPWFSMGMMVLFGLAGMAALVISICDLSLARASRRWPTADGIIIDSHAILNLRKKFVWSWGVSFRYRAEICKLVVA
jgi:hypothetical protein